MTLLDLKTGATARVLSVSVSAPSRRRLFDLGILPGTEICLLAGRGKSPRLISVFGSRYSIPYEDAAAVFLLAPEGGSK